MYEIIVFLSRPPNSQSSKFDIFKALGLRTQYMDYTVELKEIMKNYSLSAHAHCIVSRAVDPDPGVFFKIESVGRKMPDMV